MYLLPMLAGRSMPKGSLIYQRMETEKCQTECLPLTRPASRSPTNCPVKRGTSANGHRVDTGELPGLIDALLDLVGVADVEVYDGSCFRQV